MIATILASRPTRYLLGLAIGTALAFTLVAAQGESVGTFVETIAKASFGTPTALLDLTRWTAPLLLSGLAFLVGSKGGVFNTGVEGQVIIGALAAAVTGSSLNLPGPVLIVVTTLAGIVAGALWALGPAWMLRRYGINEVVTTLMLNYVAVLTCNFLVRSFFLAKNGQGNDSITVTSRPIGPAAQITTLMPASDASWTLVPTIALTLAAAAVLMWSRWGYDLGASGGAPKFAKYSGVNARSTQFNAFLISGAIGGLVGAFEVQGVLHRYIDGSLTDFGWNGILVGLIGMSHPLGIVPSAAFLGILQNGQLAVQQFTGISPYMIKLIAALFILAFAVDPIKKVLTTFRSRRDH